VDLPHPFELPLEMKKQTDNVKNLMLGRVSKVKPVLKGRKINLYICASFSQGLFSPYHDSISEFPRIICIKNVINKYI
jgi:hypothetical protein